MLEERLAWSEQTTCLSSSLEQTFMNTAKRDMMILAIDTLLHPENLLPDESA